MAAQPGNRYHALENRGKTVLQRFAEKCEFDYATGCVIWKGGTTAGRGKTNRYGAFWDKGPWTAHRWAAIHIHGIELGSNQAGHCCPHGPNTLCVQHLEAQTILENLEELNDRLKERRKAVQPAHERQFWLFVQLGIEPEPEAPKTETNDIPIYEPPAWLRPYMKPREANDDDCPF